MMQSGPISGLPVPDSEKEARFQRVAHAVMAVIRRHGVEGLRYATVATGAGVSRAWLYKYFGRDREALLAFAARTFGDAFIGRDRERASEDPERWRAALVEGTRDGLADTERTPWMVELWFRYRHQPGAAGDAVREIEQRHIEKFVHDMPPCLRRDQARAERFATLFAAARMGVFHRWIDPAFREACSPEEATGPLLGMVDDYLGRIEGG